MMKFRSSGFLLVSVGLLAGVTLFAAAAEPPASRGKQTTQRPARGGPAPKALLPDPALLDGSTQQADKQSEHGMLGEFEIPGDENVRNDRVGGQGDPSQDQSLMKNGGSPLGREAQGDPGSAGIAAGRPDSTSQGQTSGVQGGSASDMQSGQQSGQIAGGGDPNATADGIQVGQLQGEAQGGGMQGNMPSKPPAVAIGDSAMQIQGVENAPNVVGGQVAQQTQQMEEAIGGGGKGATGNNANRGVERGRTMPSGL